MSLYADYHKEQGIKRVIESEFGFVSYTINGDECYIGDIYVAPEKRRSHLTLTMFNQVIEDAKKSRCKYLTGSVIPQANDPTRSLKLILSHGFKLLRSESNIIYFIREL